MTEQESKMIRELHDFWMNSDVPKKPTRAEQIDDILMAVRAGRMGFRAILWACGALAAIAAAWGTAKGWFK